MKRIIALSLLALILCIICIPCFATSGVAMISINGDPSVPITSNLVIANEDECIVTGSGISPGITIPSGAYVKVNPNIDWVITSTLYISGTLDNYGNISRSTTSQSDNANGLLNIQTGGVVNQYFGSLVRDGGTRTITMAADSYYNLYNGSIVNTNPSANTIVVKMVSSSEFNYYNGTVSGYSIFSPLDIVNFVDGTPTVTDENGIRTYAMSSSFMATVTSLVDSSVSWIEDFVDTITDEDNSILLIFVLIGFIGLGIGLISRLKRV